MGTTYKTMKHLLLLLVVLLPIFGCSSGTPPIENFECTLFLSEYIPANEDFPDYLACWSDQGRLVFFWWHEVNDKVDGFATNEEFESYRLPNEWFDQDTGAFIPSAFWGPELGIVHWINGIHDPCEVPELVEYADLECP